MWRYCLQSLFIYNMAGKRVGACDMMSHQVSIMTRFKVIYSINRSTDGSRRIVLSCRITAHYRFGLKYEMRREEVCLQSFHQVARKPGIRVTSLRIVLETSDKVIKIIILSICSQQTDTKADLRLFHTHEYKVDFLMT